MRTGVYLCSGREEKRRRRVSYNPLNILLRYFSFFLSLYFHPLFETRDRQAAEQLSHSRQLNLAFARARVLSPKWICLSPLCRELYPSSHFLSLNEKLISESFLEASFRLLVGTSDRPSRDSPPAVYLLEENDLNAFENAMG